ncbi:MAG TPA: aminotransferase class I/II-fold pyridoxal phosphate-dependent enzyme [Myxococcota bacterium]|nr:aminotransferase class I/II-fold pyridoxal phosphate-dependent enzyme [Myxococcota bacterium]
MTEGAVTAASVVRRVPLVRPWTGPEELEAARRVLESGTLVKGPECAAFERELAERCGRQHAVAMNSGTSALWVALQALGVGPGTRVVVPDLTFPATGNAVRLCGATPVLCDVRPDTWNLDPVALRRVLADAGGAGGARGADAGGAGGAGAAGGGRGAGDAGARGADAGGAGGLWVVMPVDQFGCPADWDEIAAVAAPAGAAVLEDAACALGAERGGARPGARAAAAMLSFHPRKVVTTGEGGALVTDDAALAARFRALRDHGVGADGRFAEPALNLRFPEMAAAMGRAQLGRLDEAVRRRRAHAARYRALLADLGLGFQEGGEGVLHPYQTFAVALADAMPARDAVLAALRARGVEATLASFALHRLPHLAGSSGEAAADAAEAAEAAAATGDARFPVASYLADRAVALPLFPQMTAEDVDHVAASLRAALGG